MKNKTTEYKLFAGAFILLIAQLLILASCSTPDHEYEQAEYISILDADTFLYANNKNPSAGWITVYNGNYYSYELNEGKIKLTAERSPKRVILYWDAMDKNGRELVYDEGLSYVKRNEYEILKFVY